MGHGRTLRLFSSIRRKVQYAYKDAGAAVGMHHSLFKEARGARMLVYHGICQGNPTRYNAIFLRRKTFEAHLKFYKRYFNVLSLDDYYHQRFDKDRFNVCLTFDDGFANNFTHVLPLLEKYHVPAAFFITGVREAGYDILWNDFMGLLGKYGPGMLFYKGMLFKKNRHNKYVGLSEGGGLVETLRNGGFQVKIEMMESLSALIPEGEYKREEEYWLQMTEPQIRELSDSPWVTIGCHGYYHNDLARIGLLDAADEMRRSKYFLERLTGKKIKAIAFPYGAYSGEVAEAAKKEHFTQLLALDFLFPGDHSDPAMRQRFTVNPFISVSNQMLATIKGSYG